MPSPSDPLRLKVRDRFLTVLGAITAGADYFYTPSIVTKSFVEFAETGEDVRYVVYTDTGPSETSISGHEQYDEVFYVMVGGRIFDYNDPVSKLEKCLQVVRKAINDDATTASSGSLLQLASEGVVNVRIDSAPIIEHQMALEGYLFFFQPFLVRLQWDF